MRTGRYEHKIELSINGYVTAIKAVLDCTEDLEIVTDNNVNGVFILSMFHMLINNPRFSGETNA